MPLLPFPNEIYILKANAKLSLGGRQPSSGEASKYHYVQTQDEPSCTASYRCCTDAAGMMQLKLDTKVMGEFSVNARSLKMFHILKWDR